MAGGDHDPGRRRLEGEEEESEEDRRRREQEEAMEQMLLQQEWEQEQEEQFEPNGEPPAEADDDDGDAQQQQRQGGENNAAAEDPLAGVPNENEFPHGAAGGGGGAAGTDYLQYYNTFNQLSYTQASLGAAIGLLVYALRTRQQWYLALVYIRSSKGAYIVLANALIALCVGVFRFITRLFLGGLRLHEAEGLGDFFRWNVTETCLALTMFRSELSVSNGILFLVLVLAKCLHWVADLREGHLRQTEESIVVVQGGMFQGWPLVQRQHLKLWVLLVVLQVFDILAVQYCGQDILQNGPSVSILFGFESAILLVSAWNNLVLWHLHALDGWMHYLHEQTTPQQFMHRWIHPWKEHKATFVFAVEVQAQAAKFLFYVTFFAIVLTYYGMPINLFREVYVSFQALRQRLMAFAKYRRLMASMNRFQSVSEEELEEAGSDCIICRDDMTINDSKKLPGCGHIFHKSCLREWLVQQQSCPTCRGDISAMEQQAAAEQARREAAEARAEAAEQPEDDSEETAEDDHPSPDGNAVAVDATSAGINVHDLTRAHFQQRNSLFPNAADQSSTASYTAAINNSSNSNAASKRARFAANPVQENPPFPALYRVVKDEGARVWNDDNSVQIRTVPFGVVVLCQTLQWKSDRGFMMRVPDGWVSEDSVVRVGTLASLKQRSALQQQQEQHIKV